MRFARGCRSSSLVHLMAIVRLLSGVLWVAGACQKFEETLRLIGEILVCHDCLGMTRARTRKIPWGDLYNVVDQTRLVLVGSDYKSLVLI